MQFVRGCRSQIDIVTSQINRLPLKLLNELICGKINVDYDVLMEYLKFKNFENPEESEAIKKMIQSYITTDTKYIEKLLLAMTGTSKIPVLGYNVDYPLTIELKSDAKKPFEIHTCYNQMFINKETFENFHISPEQKTTQLYEHFSSEALINLSNQFSIA